MAKPKFLCLSCKKILNFSNNRMIDSVTCICGSTDVVCFYDDGRFAGKNSGKKAYEFFQEENERILERNNNQEKCVHKWRYESPFVGEPGGKRCKKCNKFIKES